MGPQAPQVFFVGQHHHRPDHDHTYASYSSEQGNEVSLVDDIAEVNCFLPFLGNKHWVCQAYQVYFASLLAQGSYSSD